MSTTSNWWETRSTNRQPFVRSYRKVSEDQPQTVTPESSASAPAGDRSTRTTRGRATAAPTARSLRTAIANARPDITGFVARTSTARIASRISSRDRQHAPQTGRTARLRIAVRPAPHTGSANAIRRNVRPVGLGCRRVAVSSRLIQLRQVRRLPPCRKSPSARATRCRQLRDSASARTGRPMSAITSVETG